MRLEICVLVALVLSVPSAMALVELELVESVGNYTAGQNITGTIVLTYDEFVPKNSVIRVFIDSIWQDSLGMESYLHELDYYTPRNISFGYNISAHGSSHWYEYPEQEFDYLITAGGTCGGDYCSGVGQECLCPDDCDPISPPEPYPCDWYYSSGLLPTSYVNGNDDLKEIRDGNTVIGVPEDNNGDTLWSVIVSGSETVEGTMRVACGGGVYTSVILDDNGWIKKSLDVTNRLVGTDCILNIQPFDHESLNENYRKYGGPDNYPGGGVYKTEGGINYYLSSPIEVEWNGSTGEIVIHNCDITGFYKVVYLPPNGNMFCAYTDYKIPNSTNWIVSETITGSCNYNTLYSRTFTQSELDSLLLPPNCPGGGETECNHMVDHYSVMEVSDPEDAVVVEFDSGTKEVTVSTSKMMFDQSYIQEIGLGDFLLKAFDSVGPHIILFELKYGSSLLSSVSKEIYTCADPDGDGYCGDMDCDENENSVYAGALELCDGLDNDCDGRVDEDYMMVESALGTPCGPPYSACEGVYVCSEDKLSVVCSNPISPGDLPEICGNDLDDDCDGEVDDLDQGGCEELCSDGQTRECGSSEGICTPGVSICQDGEWGVCVGGTTGMEEICNGLDDDCDGLIDDVWGKNSVAETRCGCYGGASPSTEVCNDIDDDCDGEVDEGILCCSESDTRDCGTDVGECQPGVQYCSQGSWETQCYWGVAPIDEICYNDKDDDCDGEVDEYCTPEITCGNGIFDLNENGIDCGGVCPRLCETPWPWYLFGLGVVIVIIVFIVHGTGYLRI